MVGAGFRVESGVAAGVCAERLTVAVRAVVMQSEMRHFAPARPTI